MSHYVPGLPPPPPGPYATASYLPPPPPPPRSKRLSRLGLIAGILALFGVLGGIVVALNGDNGAGSPQEAVERFLTAASNEDIVGAARLLPPNEIGSAPDLYDLIVKVAAKNEGVGSKGQPLDGIDLEFRDMKFETSMLAERVGKVAFTAGEIRIDVNEAELSPALRDSLFDEDGAPGGSDVITIDRINREMISWSDEMKDSGAAEGFGLPLNGELSGLFVATSKIDGRWYVSYQYTLMEYARELLGARIPDFAEPTRGQGAETPAAVIDAFSTRMSSFTIEELRRMIDDPAAAQAESGDYIDTTEFQAFVDYLPVFAALQEGVLGTAAPRFDTTFLDGIDEFSLKVRFESNTTPLTGDRAKVTVNAGTIAFTVRGEQFGDPLDLAANVKIYDGLCAQGATSERDFRGRLQTDRFDECATVFENVDFDGFFVVTVKKNGRWYLSVNETLVEYVRLALENELAK